MERRLNRLSVVWRLGGARVVSPQERQLASWFGWAIDFPVSCAAATAADQLAYLRRIIAHSRADGATVERALVAALTERGCIEREVAEAIRTDGLDALLEALTVRGAEVATWQDAERERDEQERSAVYETKKAAAKAAYVAAHPYASDRDFEIGWWPRVHWQTDNADELAAMAAVSEEKE
jgi:hypothetical protein